MGPPLTRTEEGWEIQFATNHLGHFLLTNLLLPALKKSDSARVANLSSAGHWLAPVNFADVHFEKREYDPFVSYGQSKTANIWFAAEFNRRTAGDGIASFSVHPGGIRTELGRYMEAEAMKVAEKMIEEIGDRIKTIPQGAATSCWAATSPELDGKRALSRRLPHRGGRHRI